MNTLLSNALEKLVPSSAWREGVKAYALELAEKAEVELTRDNALTELLNGADNWSEYSWGGCSYVYNGDIAERLCTPSELKVFEAGKANKPNAKEEWLDVQARALSQAYQLIIDNLFYEEGL